jgi:Na+/phosphate symporter
MRRTSPISEELPQSLIRFSQQEDQMNMYLQFFVTIPFIVLMCQFYLWVVSLHGVERQNHCRALGVTYCTAGTVCFLFRSLPLALVGLMLFMLGLRLIAHGLDRIGKSIFIDRFDEDR